MEKKGGGKEGSCQKGLRGENCQAAPNHAVRSQKGALFKEKRAYRRRGDRTLSIFYSTSGGPVYFLVEEREGEVRARQAEKLRWGRPPKKVHKVHRMQEDLVRLAEGGELLTKKCDRT